MLEKRRIMLIIRRMKLQDCEQVAIIEEESFSMPWSLQAFQDTVEMKNYRYFVAEQNGEILGYCGFIFVLDEAEIPNVCVKLSVRKQGIGKQMLTVLEEEAKGLGIKNLYLEVRESNQSARKLYTSFGFEEDGIRRDFYELPKENAVLMHKSI